MIGPKQLPGEHKGLCVPAYEPRCAKCRDPLDDATRRALAPYLAVDGPNFDCPLKPWLSKTPAPVPDPPPVPPKKSGGAKKIVAEHSIRIVGGRPQCSRCVERGVPSEVSDVPCPAGCKGPARLFTCSGCKTQRKMPVNDLRKLGWSEPDV